MKLTNEMVFHHAVEWSDHGRNMYEFDDGDVLLLNNSLEVKLTNDSHPDFLQGIIQRMEDGQVVGVFVYGDRDAYIEFLKAGDFE